MDNKEITISKEIKEYLFNHPQAYIWSPDIYFATDKDNNMYYVDEDSNFITKLDKNDVEEIIKCLSGWVDPTQSDIVSSIKLLQEDFAELKSNIEDYMEETDDQISSLNNKLYNMQSDIDCLESDVSDNESRISDLEQ